MKEETKKICLLEGGDSFEREISLRSAEICGDVLRKLGYEVCEFDFTGDVLTLISYLKKVRPDGVFNALHGGSGENGNVQSLLNFLKIPYTHSGVLASSLAMNKYVSCNLFEHGGIAVIKYTLERWQHLLENRMDFAYPFVVKPVDSGSSDGVYVIHSPADLSAIEWTNGEQVLVSAYVPGLELTVGVLDSAALEVTNIITSSGFFDYDNKYSKGKTFHEIPAKIPDSIRKMALDYALRAHNLLGCRGISRTDFRYNDVTNELFVMELNTQPGMTALSLLPEQADFVGISLDQLLQRMLELACYDE
ncbi:MAG: D-alanine--D-alanine ligase [Holosporaceae bacterium]|jgi:D-alanine-D-alanine ligase|nr:D-alanine--D-alanine ligase [Holosporaceae bacterium]